MFEFDSFRDEVLKDYLNKRDQGLLKTNLENPSPANLRNYALHVFYQGLRNEDLSVFLEFFNSKNKSDDLERVIKRADLGRMRSVQNFINGTTRDPDEIIVKLLAVFIDFEPRPFNEWRKTYYNVNNVESEVEETDEVSPNTFISEIKNEVLVAKPDQHIKKNKIKNTLILSLVGISFGSIGYLTSINLKSDGCMYWDGTRYIAIDCQEESIKAEKIILNQKDLEDFQKITRTDTLRKKHEKKVWYSKIDNEVEFFTRSGNHPVDRSKFLKPATWYIIKKYRDSTSNKSY